MLSDKKVKIERHRVLIPLWIRKRFGLHDYIRLEEREENGRRSVVLNSVAFVEKQDGTDYGED
jgi:hypothetical protein